MIILDYTKRLSDVIDISWEIFKSQFIYGRIKITREAPFQHHFANIIKNIGDLYCISRDEHFFVDLESKFSNIKNKNNYVDITCGFISGKKESKAAIELKFKTKKQGAQDYGRIDSYIDIETIEFLKKKEFEVGRFFMITDSTAYIKPSTRGVGTIFQMHNNYKSEPGSFCASNCKGRNNVKINLYGSYLFKWDKQENFYFLKLDI